MIRGDYHTHTRYSHGKGTVLESALRASELGLKELAITDHGFKHRTYGLRRVDLPHLRKEINEAQRQFPMLKILLGTESNLLDSKGKIDAKISDGFDFLICGYHKFVSAPLRFTFPIFLAGLTSKSSAKLIAVTTDAYIKAMEKNPISIITHPNLGLKTNIREIAKAARHFGVYLELNGKRVKLTRDDVEIIQDEGAEFVINSDAHSPQRVGSFDCPLDFARENGIDFSLIANWDKLPSLKKA